MDYTAKILQYIGKYNEKLPGKLILIHVDWDISEIVLFYNVCCGQSLSIPYDSIERDIKHIYPFENIVWKYRGRL